MKPLISRGGISLTKKAVSKGSAGIFWLYSHYTFLHHSLTRFNDMEYDNPKGIIAGAVLMQVMVSTLCINAFYTRRWQKSQIMISDWLILAAATCGAGLTVIEIYGMHPIGLNSIFLTM